MNTPRVAVVGAGAVGGYFGAMLARAGAPVTLIGRSRHVDVWKRNGLFLESANFQGVIPVQASTELDAARDADLVLFAVKAIDTEHTGRQLARSLRSGTLVISLQNGVDNVPRMRAAAALDPIAAVVYVASSMPVPGSVKHAGRGDLIIGDLPGRLGEDRCRVRIDLAGSRTRQGHGNRRVEWLRRSTRSRAGRPHSGQPDAARARETP
jgi:2-dehydropantoate 2-reductase